MSLDILFDKTVIVQKLVITVMTTGAYEETWQFHKSIKCRLQPMFSAKVIAKGFVAERIRSRRQLTEKGIKMYCFPGNDLEEPDRIVFNGRTFGVMGVQDNDEQGRFLTVDLMEVL